jgi:hypothetical protein
MFSPRRKRSSIAGSTVSPANETAALMIMNKKERPPWPRQQHQDWLKTGDTPGGLI